MATAEATVVDTPSVSESMPEQALAEDQPVTLMSKVAQDGQPVTWYKDGKELQDGDDGCIISSDGVTSTLTLPSSEVADSSEYTTKSGDVESAAELLVSGKQHMSFSSNLFKTFHFLLSYNDLCC